MSANSDAVLFEPLKSVPASQLAVFHEQNLTGKLVSLGRHYVHYFYKTLSKLEDISGWAATRKGNLVGIVLGSLHGKSVLGGMVKTDPSGWLFHTTISVFLHPLRSMQVAWGILRGSGEQGHSDWPVLHYIAVNADERGQGIGEGLMRRFAGDLATIGQTHFDLSVIRDNQQAIRFYEKHGGQMPHDYVTAGLEMRRFSFDVKTVLG